MTDSSDGETKNRQFINLTNIEPNQLAFKLVQSFALQKACYSLNQGVTESVCINELESNSNTEQFKKHLAIPRNTIIEPNLNKKSASFLTKEEHKSKSFKHKSKSHSIKIKLDDEQMIRINDLYINNYLKTDQSGEKSIPIDNENTNPVVEPQKNQNETIEKKIDKLIQQVNKLTQLLLDEKEKNKQLSEKLMQYEMNVKCSKQGTKRKKKADKNGNNKKQYIEIDDDVEMCFSEASSDIESRDTENKAKHIHNEHVVKNTTTTSTKSNNADPRGFEV